MHERRVTQRPVRRLERGEPDEAPDEVAVEEPLEIRVDGEPLAITMRTPGRDHQLALGFLYAEGVVGSLADVGSVAHCGRPGEEGFGNVVDVVSGPGVRLDVGRLEGARRGTLTTSACGVCGRRSIEDLLARAKPVERELTVSRALIAGAPAQLRTDQVAFVRTGGAHAAAAISADGTILAHAEDVGRHNAVDKVVGQLLYDQRLGDDGPAILAVSGRVSFEIVQKAACARIPILAAVSAPTSLAIDLASEAQITLAAFVREGRMNLYCRPERIT